MKIAQVHTGNKLERRKLKDLRKGDTVYVVDFIIKEIMKCALVYDIEHSGAYFKVAIQDKDGFRHLLISDIDTYINDDFKTKTLVSDLDALYEREPQTKTFKMK